MQKIKAFGDWLTKWFTVIVIVWAVFNYFVPQTSLWGKSYTGYFLGIVLFGMGLTLMLDDFKRILTQPLMVVVGTVAHFVIMPLVAVLLCWIFRLDGPLAVGVILVGCCPSGTSSNVMSYLSRGDVALDVSIGILSTLCAPFMIPLLMQWLASQYVTVPVESLFLNAVKVVLFPIALGVICHAIFKEKIEKVTVALPIVSQVATTRSPTAPTWGATSTRRPTSTSPSYGQPNEADSVTLTGRPASRARGAIAATAAMASAVVIPWFFSEKVSVTITTRLTSSTRVSRARSKPRSLSTSPM